MKLVFDGLQLAKDFNASRIELLTDSLLVVSQINEEYVAKDVVVQRYLARVKELLKLFLHAKVRHVPHGENARADILSKLAIMKTPGNLRSIIQETLSKASVSLEAGSIGALCAVSSRPSWIIPILRYIEFGEEPTDPKEETSVRKWASFYSVIDRKLYHMGFSMQLLKCLEGVESDYVLAEVHEGIGGQHHDDRALAKKALRTGYYWPTMTEDAKDFIKKFDKYQRHVDIHITLPIKLTSLAGSLPFALWGINIFDPFPTVAG